MSRFKRPKKLLKRKNKTEDETRIIRGEKHEVTRTESEQKCSKKPCGRREKTAKEVHFAVVPDKYEPLLEEETADKTTQERCEKQHKYKQFRKVCTF